MSVILSSNALLPLREGIVSEESLWLSKSDLELVCEFELELEPEPELVERKGILRLTGLVKPISSELLRVLLKKNFCLILDCELEY